MWILEFLAKLFSIFDKLTPSKKEQYNNQLNSLEVEYQKALQEGRDTDAAIIRKKMDMIRKKLDTSDDL